MDVLVVEDEPLVRETAVADKLRRRGANLCRTMVEVGEALARRQGKGEHHCHTVRVEPFPVEWEGQDLTFAQVKATSASPDPAAAPGAAAWSRQSGTGSAR